MRRASAAPSRRGSLDRNGSLEEEQRMRTSRPRLSFLARVDEAFEDGADDHAVRSPSAHAPESLSSDEETENFQRQSARAAGNVGRSGGDAAAKATYRQEEAATAPRAQRMSVVSRRSSSRPPLQNVSREVGRSRRESLNYLSGDVIAATLNEKKQKKLVALFFWRRRTLETYVLAWKWAVFDAMPSAGQAQPHYELTRLRQYTPAPIRPMRMFESAPRHQSALLLNTTRRQRRDSMGSVDRPSNHRDRMDSLREEYRQLKATALDQQQTSNSARIDASQEQDDAAANRIAFRVRLRVYYVCFDAWREFVSERRVERSQLEERALRHFKKRQLRKHFHTWAKPFLVVQREERRCLLHACEKGNRLVKRRRFRSWMQFHRRCQLVHQQTLGVMRVRMAHSVSRWHDWMVRTIRLRHAAFRRTLTVLRRYLSRLQAYRIRRRRTKSVYESAVALSERLSLRRVWSQWHRTVFANDVSSCMNATSYVLAKKSAVARWKRFVARQRERQMRAEQADCRLYEGLLRRFWGRWCSYLILRSEERGVYGRALHHWASHHKRRAVRALLSARCERKYDRDRIQAAQDFFHRQIASKALVKWRGQASMTSRSRHFRLVRVRRQYVLAFMAWRQYAKQSRHTSQLGDMLWLRTRSRMLRRSMQLWLYRHKLRAAFQILDSRYAARLLERHTKAWRSMVLHRRRWRGIFRRFRSTREVAVLRRVFAVWRGLAVGSRCRRRLIRLFQKKHLCKKLRACVQVLASNAAIQRLERAANARRLAGVWHAWVTFRSDQQNRRESTVAATQFYVARRYSVALRLWKENVRDWAHSRQTNARAVRYLIYSMMRKTLHAWYKRCQVWGRRRKLIELRIAKLERSRLRQRLYQWNSAARTMCRERHELHRIWCRATLRRLERVFSLWRAHTSQRNDLRRLVQGQQCKVALRRGRAILRAWRATALNLRKRYQAAREVASHWRERTQRRVLHAWRVVAAEMHRDRMNTIKAASFHREFLLLWAFYGWQHAALERQVLREKQDRGTMLIARRRLHRAILLWKRKRVLRRDDKAKLIQAAAFYRKRRRLRGIEAWSEFIWRRRERHEEVKRAVIFAASKLKRRSFGAWLRHSAGTRVFKLKLRLIFQTGEDSIQRRAFRCWRRYKRVETLANRANRWRQRFLQRLVWHHWRQQVTFSRKMRANVLITNRLLQNNVARTSFTRWKRFVETQQQLVQANANAEQFHHARCYRLALRQFRHAVRHARAVELSTTFHTAHMQRQQFMNWRRAVTAQKKWKAQKVSVVKRYRMLRLNSVFCGWRLVVQSKQRALDARAERHINSLALRHAWKIWRRTVLCQHLADGFVCRRIKREFHTAFRDWIQFVREQRLIRSHVDAAVAHVDRVIKQKVWERWMEFLDERHTYHRLEDAATSFYTKIILLRRTFKAWSNHRAQRRSRRAQNLQAEDHCTATVLQKGFDHWEAYVAYRHSREATKIAENDTSRRMVASRAVCKWHKRASVLRSLTSAESRAKKFFVRRAETGAIHRLREHATAKIQTRKGRAHAVAHRASRLTLMLFTQWKNFLAWRRRHRHLLRLFRSNQQHEYFALWCKYVARNRRKRELQATATRGYRNLVQRGVFMQWHERCDYWRAKRRGIRWYHQRLTRRVLEVWARRVHVLRMMRHMLRFQDSFRLETHFDTWKRYWWRKKQQIARVQDAAVWFKKHRKEKCFSMWLRWVELRQQEKNTLRMAIGFRTRFFSRKYLHAWRLVVESRKRKSWLQEEAQQRFHRTLYARVFDKFRAFAKLRKCLTGTSAVLTKTLMEMRIQRSVHRWCEYLRQSRRRRALEMNASLHYRQVATRRIWIHLQAWHAVRRVKQGKSRRAQRFCERGVCRRALLAWVLDVRNKHRQRIGLQRFKDRYFCGVADDCFLRWSKFVRFKRRLRLLKHRVDRSRQQRALQAWRMRTHESRKRLDALATIQARRHRALLRRCVLHWESVATNCWMYQHLVRAAWMHRERRAKSCALMRWKSLLPLRRARREWRERASIRHRTLLVAVLRQWRWLTVERDSDANLSSSSNE